MEEDSFEYQVDYYREEQSSQSVSQGFSDNQLPTIQTNPQVPEHQILEKSHQLSSDNLKPQLTPLLEFQLTEQNGICKICYKYAVEGVQCKNEKCSVLFCGNCARQAVKKIENKCPFCRISPFEPIPSPYQQIINKMQLVCTLCQSKYILQEELNHYKNQCLELKKVQCRYCPLKLRIEELVKHTRIYHEDKLDDIIQYMYDRPLPHFNPKDLTAKQSVYLNKINKAPHLGTTGKFYCGAKLQAPKCSCCNGYCGPTNGQNCVQCMKLDIQRFGLPKGHLINSSGHPCWLQGERFVCGIMNYYENTSCREEAPCRSCNNMRKNVKRYKDLL